MTLPIPPGTFAGYIYDCDGTLVDSMPLHHEAWNHGLREAGAAWDLPEDYFYAAAGKSLQQVIDELNELNRDAVDAASVGLFKEKYYHDRIDKLRAFPDVAEHLRVAHGRGIPTAVASGSARDAVVRSLEITGLMPHIDVVVAAEDVERGKPAPDCFLLAAERMGVDPTKCLVFEDGRAGLTAAEICGMATVQVDARRVVPNRKATVTDLQS